MRLLLLLLLLVPAETFLIVMDFTEKHFFIHAATPLHTVVVIPPVVVVFPLFPLLHVLQFKRIGLRLDLLLWPGESPDSACVCVSVFGSCASKSYFRYK